MKVHWRTILTAAAWTGCGSMVIAAGYLAVGLSEFAPWTLTESGASLIGAAVLAGFLLGLLGSDIDLGPLVFLCLAMTVGSLAIALLVVFAPMFTGVVASVADLASTDAQRQALFFAEFFVFPMALLGGVLGKVFGERVMPTEEELAVRTLLRSDTRRWHEVLEEARRAKETERRPKG